MRARSWALKRWSEVMSDNLNDAPKGDEEKNDGEHTFTTYVRGFTTKRIVKTSDGVDRDHDGVV